MKTRHQVLVLVLLSIFFIPSSGFSGPGDTLIVQAFTFQERSPYDSRVVFPAKDKRFEKILMYYKLKCNPEQNPACGEWDYLTYTYLYRNTGRYDSTLQSHPNFTMNGASPDTLSYTMTPTWTDRPDFEKSIVYIDTTSFSSAQVGTGIRRTTSLHTQGTPDYRVQYLWKADELIAAGLAPGVISAVRLGLHRDAGTHEKFTVRIKSTTRGALDARSPEVDGFTTVYRRQTTFSGGWHILHFMTPFSWDGTSNLLIDFSFERKTGNPIILYGDTTGWDACIQSIEQDPVLDFAPVDHIDVPAAKLGQLDTAITVAFWAFGDPDRQPIATSAFEGLNGKNQRVVNAHLPWNNGRIYWDAGNIGGSYDRIDKEAQPDDYRGRWNHWTFTKRVPSGEMKIYLNGTLWHSGTGKSKTMSGIEKFRIGSNGRATGNYYDGMIDDFIVWDVALEDNAIREVMHATGTGPLPREQRIVVRYGFDEGSGEVTTEAVSGTSSPLVGRPEWSTYGGERVKKFTTWAWAVRPMIVFEQGTFTSRIDSIFVLDSIPNHRMMIVLFSDTLHPNIPTDTVYYWPPVVRYRYDAAGNIVDSVVAQPDGYLVKKSYDYYERFEVVDRYELGRFITPYGIGLDLGEGWTWVYDISDFRPLLTDTVRITAGNWQELLDLRFVMIEGTPPRDVVKIENVWNGNFALNQFVQRVPPVTVALDPAAEMYRLKVTTTGHQFSNPTNCAEFCPKIHSVDVGGTRRFQWQIIQECALNPLYPQGGTWIFDRSGWCPGMPGTTQDLELTQHVSGSSVTLDYNSEYDDYGNYIVETQLVSYTAPNFQVDASIDEIIEPNRHELHSRYNPSCGKPRIRIRNTGATTLNSLDISYGPEGGSRNSHHWTGSLGFLAVQEVELPVFDWGVWNPDNLFTVTVSNPNGGADEYAHNNTLTVPFEPVPIYDKPLIVNLKTNNRAAENYYEILDANGIFVTGRFSLTNNTVYRDTLFLPPGCYEFVLHDAGNDGIDFWYNRQQAGSGSMVFRMAGAFLYKSLNPDFGMETRYQFIMATPTSVRDDIAAARAVHLYPNPSTGYLMVDFTIERAAAISIEIFDAMGRVVKKMDPKELPRGLNQEAIVAGDLPPGTYLITIRDGETILYSENLRIIR